MTDDSLLDTQATLKSMTPVIYERFLEAIAIGKWPSGEALTSEQKETCMQAIILYEAKHIPENQRTGYVPPKTTPCDDEQPLSWKK